MTEGGALRSWWVVALLGAAIGIAFAPVVDYGWVFDDTRQIVDNDTIASWGGLRQAFVDTLWSFDPSRPEDPRGSYRPLFVWYLTAGRQAFGVDPAGWHVVGVLLHAVATGVVWRLALRLRLSPLAAAMTAALFALHPVQIQAVAWVSAVTDPLQMIAMGTALLWWLRTLEGGGWRWAVATAIAFGVGLLLIERAFAFAAVLGIAAVVWPTRVDRADVVRRGRAMLPWCAVAVAVVVLRVWATGDAARSTAVVTWPEAIWTAPALARQYAEMLVLPVDLALGYPIGVTTEPSLTRFVVPLSIELLVVVAMAYASRGRPARQLLLGAAVVTLLPALDARWLHPQLLVQDRYVYVPAAFTFAWLADVVVSSPRRTGRLAAVGVWGALLLVLHRPNLEPWHDRLSLYTHAAAVAPGHPTFAMNLSNERRREGLDDPGCALLLAARASLDDPAWRGSVVPVEYNLGNCFREQADPVSAVAHFRTAVAASGGHAWRARFNLAALHLDLGDLAAAEADIEALCAEHPELSHGFRLAGLLAARRGDLTAARAALAHALEVDPSDAQARAMLADLPGP